MRDGDGDEAIKGGAKPSKHRYVLREAKLERKKGGREETRA